MAQAIARLASGPAAIPTISAITEANVHRTTFYNRFTSAEEAYAISIGFEEFQLLDYGGRHLGADPTNVALRTLRAILDYVTEHREPYRLASSGRSATGLACITDLLVEQVHSFRVEFGATAPDRARRRRRRMSTWRPAWTECSQRPSTAPRVRRRAHRRDALFAAAGMGEAVTSLDRRASPTMDGLRRSGQLASLPLARRLSVVPAERRGEGVRRGVAGAVGDLGEGQLAGPQVVAGEGHPPVGQVLHGRLAE
jgi:AcrR family transcriptional regulator